MIPKNLEKAIEEEFLPIYPNISINILSYRDIYPDGFPRKGYLIKLTLGESDSDLPEGRFEMWYNTEKQRFEDGYIFLRDEARGKGLGRKLVEARESLAKSLGCSYVLVDINTNPSFWNHMGYTQWDEREFRKYLQ